ncbi:hypothetical protein FQN57_007049 [Myotisia sp. PD_48]|nr:hypothetical protein FQN57_007049 [Myotisia sp. PD_48]
MAEVSQTPECIKGVVANYLNVDPSKCDIANWKINGSGGALTYVFLLLFETGEGNKLELVRLPLPYKVGEEFRPGNSAEKVRCEAGNYAWLQEKHPDIPIPQLYGFSLSPAESIPTLPYTPPDFLWIGKILSLENRVLSCYVQHTPSIVTQLDTPYPYVLIEFIEPKQGRMLSDTWFEDSDHKPLRTTLFRGLARIMLSLARVPFPRIGSFVIDSNGFISLSNRPLTLDIQDLENEEISIDIPRHYTYSTTDSYIADILSLHDSRLIHQPNAINNGMEYIQQVSTLSAMRISTPLFFRRDLRRGPFIFSFPDLHQSNIFVDEEWNITSLVDLE